MQLDNMDLLGNKIKNQLLDDENLTDATDDLKDSIEKDIEGDFEAEKFEQLTKARDTIVISGFQSAKNWASDAKHYKSEVEDLRESDDFADARRKDMISAEDFNTVLKAYREYKNLYQHFLMLFYGEYQYNSKVSTAISLQRSRQLQKDQMEIIQENIPNVIEKAFEESDRIDQVESELQDIEKLREKVEELENRLQETDYDEDPGGTEDDSGKDPLEELTSKQLSILKYSRENPEADIDQAMEDLDNPKGTLVQSIRKISEKGFEISDELEKAVDEG